MLLTTQTWTFLFTDVEGSTQLLQLLGEERYENALEVHNAVIRSALAAHGGREVSTQGDGFFAVFSSARTCVAAAVEMQRALTQQSWPSGGRMHVRMGIHSGEASETTSTGFVGLEVHRAARLAAVAHGGQIVLSAIAAGLGRDSLPCDASLRDLGRHRLKDLGRPEHVFQLEVVDLEHSFPPLRSLDSLEKPNNLPSHPSSFIGREAELAEVRLLVETNHLVTLAGAGGSGKTRLALQAAAALLDSFVEGVWFVDLAVVSESEQVASAVMSTLEAREDGRRSAVERLVETLEHQRILIVLDNCEHVIDGSAKVAEAIQRYCRAVHLIATSREPLGIDGEHVHRLPALSLPDDNVETLEDLQGSEAVELFVERARARDSTFALDDSGARIVASICRRLDGVPFAIELAAARVSTMSLVDLESRLDQSFRLLIGGSRTALPHQRTLQATLDWSYALLSPYEREVLCRLSVFAANFDLEAAEAVCAEISSGVFEVTELVGSLVNKSLVIAERSATSVRYGLLETVRQYGADHLLELGGEVAVAGASKAHAEHYLALSERVAPELEGDKQGRLFQHLDVEWANLRAALVYFSADADSEKVLRLGIALHRFLLSRGRLEPIATVRTALECSEGVPDELRARAYFAAGWAVSYLLGLEDRIEMRSAVELYEQALMLAIGLGETRLRAETLALLSYTVASLDEGAQAIRHAEEALAIAQGIGDPRLVGHALHALGLIWPEVGKRPEFFLEALANCARAGDTWYMSHVLLSLGMSSWVDHDLGAARAYHTEALALADEMGSRELRANLQANLCEISLLQGDLQTTAVLARETLVEAHRTGRRSRLVFAIFYLVCCWTDSADYWRAAELTGAHDALDAVLFAVISTGAAFWPPELQMLRDENRTRLRDWLGEAEFDRAYKVGSSLSLEEACDLALGKTDPR